MWTGKFDCGEFTLLKKQPTAFMGIEFKPFGRLRAVFFMRQDFSTLKR